MPLDPWIIEEIKKREEEQRREQERQQPTVEIDLPQEEPAQDAPKPGHEMPADRKPGYEMPNPNESGRPAEKKKDEAPQRGVDISRITGGDDDEDDGTIDIAKALKKIEEEAPPEGQPDGGAQKPPVKKPD